MTDSPSRPMDLLSEAELLARFWTSELVRDVLGPPDWKAGGLVVMAALLAKGVTGNVQPGWHAARVIAAEEHDLGVQKERATQYNWRVPPEDCVSREDLYARGWSDYAIATLLPGKDWPPRVWRGYEHQRPEVHFRIERVAKIEADPNFTEQLQKLNAVVVGAG